MTTDLSMYECAIGESYASLPQAVQRFHRLKGRSALLGQVETEAPDGVLAWLLAWCLGTPRSAVSGPLRFDIDAAPAVESWTRRFPTRTMSSRLRLVDGQIEEHLGAARLTFRLHPARRCLRMELTGMRFLRVPCPNWLLPRVVAEEAGDGDELHFNVLAALPLIGVVANYRGHLRLGSQERS